MNVVVSTSMVLLSWGRTFLPGTRRLLLTVQYWEDSEWPVCFTRCCAVFVVSPLCFQKAQSFCNYFLHVCSKELLSFAYFQLLTDNVSYSLGNAGKKNSGWLINSWAFAGTYSEIWICSHSSNLGRKWYWCSGGSVCWIWVQGWTVEFYPARDCCPLCKGCLFANSQELPCPPKYHRGLPWSEVDYRRRISMSRSYLCWPPQRPIGFSRTLQSVVFRLSLRHLYSTATMWSPGGSFSCWECCVNAWNALQGFLQAIPPDKYLWNPSNCGYQVTRRRNFFRNFDDVESIPSPTLVFGDQYGPLLRPNGNTIPLAPLLRTRDTLPHGIIRASWTLCQPHALVWDMLTGMERVTSPP